MFLLLLSLLVRIPNFENISKASVYGTPGSRLQMFLTSVSPPKGQDANVGFPKPVHGNNESPRHSTFFCGWFAVEPFLPPPPHWRHAADSRAFSAPPRHTGGMRQIFDG